MKSACYTTRNLAALVLLAGINTSAWADDLDDGLAYLKHNDCPNAVRVLRPLAAEGNALAQTTLATMYYNGCGVPRDYEEAAKWHQLAAEQGDAYAQFSLGGMYVKGEGVKLDKNEAIRLFQLSANQGYYLAQHLLGLSYVLGEGVPKDSVQGYLWLNLAAAQGDEEAAKMRDALAAEMTPSQIEEAQRLAREWLAAHPQ